jgi:hypothetical protein
LRKVTRNRGQFPSEQAGKGSGITPPTCRNHRQATVFDTPTDAAASAITIPDRTADQNPRWTSTEIAGRPPTLMQHLN